MKLCYGIISCATITDRFMHAVLEYGDSLGAIASRTIETAQKKAQPYGISAYGSYEELYSDKRIDVIYIASNNATHVHEIKRALFHGKHVICEKPIALSKSQAKEVFEFAKEKGLFLMEAQKSVFLPVMQDIKRHIQTQTFGHLHQVEMSCSFPSPSSPWMHDPTQGGVVFGSANYTLELLDYLVEPETTNIQASGLFESTKTCDRVSMNIVMDDTLINSRISMNGDTLHHAIFYFEQGYIHVPSYWKAREYTIHSQQHSSTIQHPIDYEMIYEVAHIHECIEKGLLESPIMSANRSITCCAWVDEINSQIRKQ